MSALDLIVDVVITQETQAVPLPSFGSPLILGPTGFGNSDVVRGYTSPQAMLADGFTTSDIEYIYMLEAFEQALSPSIAYVGKRTSDVAQVVTISVANVDDTHLYTLTLNGTQYQYQAVGGNTQDDILTGLIAAIGSPTGLTIGALTSHTFTVTAAVAGTAFTYTADVKLTATLSTPNHGPQDDIQTILNDPIGNLWYGLALCSNSAADIENTAGFIETLKKIYIAVSSDAGIDSGSSTDVASILQGKGYKRTALMYSPGSAALGIEAAWLGGSLPADPGSNTWKFNNLVGITPDFFTDSSRLRLIGSVDRLGNRTSSGKNVNIYETVGGTGVTEEGWMAGGQFIDQTIFGDWLQANIQSGIFTALVNAGKAGKKIPYTDKGVGVIESIVRAVLKQGSDDGGTGGIDHTTIVVNTVPVANLPVTARANRILPNNAVTFTARGTGALHFVNINGVVTV